MMVTDIVSVENYKTLLMDLNAWERKMVVTMNVLNTMNSNRLELMVMEDDTSFHQV